MLTQTQDTKQTIQNLSNLYPTQIPIIFSTHAHTVSFLDFTISLNNHALFTGSNRHYRKRMGLLKMGLFKKLNSDKSNTKSAIYLPWQLPIATPLTCL